MNSHNKYLMAEHFIKQQLDEGRLVVEEKLPSIRSLSHQLNVSKNTVIRAYQELEAQGVVYSVPKSGYRVRSDDETIKPLLEPSSVDLLSVCKEVLTHSQEKEWLATGSAHPFIDTNAIKSLYAEIGRHSRRQANLPSHYQLPPGNDQLIKHLRKISQDLEVNVATNEIAITHGAQQAISLALRAITQPGDIIAVESPCYFGNLLLMQSLSLKVVEIQSCPKSGIEPIALKEALETWDIKAILVTPNFTNPTGARMPLHKRLKLLEVTQNIPIIEDDVFGALAFDDGIAPLKSLDKQNRVIYVNSLSKMLDSRLRIGWICAGQYQAKVEKFLLCDNMGSLNLMQSAVGEFLGSGKYRPHVQKMQRLYQANLKLFHHHLTQSLNQYPELVGQYHAVMPQGSFLLWLMLPSKLDSWAVYKALKDHQISTLPGTLFGTSGQYKNCIRFSCSNFLANSEWKTGVEKLASIIHHQLTTQ
ncbi:PLP-dependent aminotransferase family protein [Vibrio aquaticus]|uniref:PLP-dependent aminotransferase family protein n=1 Tax=Vibrio aquaticus TaxID=2496559 RepID=A0A3S0PRU0_9VIBR|nr:PLP-dependent aminotransferase family protein [Vibrio aquaticus]RTZ18217.1 PLP-dependent aminotransferase family protein [Vibrio aquaticus]